jgi:hypothetical protein
MPRAAAKPSFEVADANRVLPLVRSIVTDIVANYRRMRELTREQRALKADAASPTTEAAIAAMAAVKTEAEERSARMDDYVRELSELNVDLKDPERGLVDFACERGGRTVLLCWELGEPSVAHWHGVEENFFDRRPMSSLPAATDASARTRTESGGTKRAADRGDAGRGDAGRGDAGRGDAGRREPDRRDGDAGPSSA